MSGLKVPVLNHAISYNDQTNQFEINAWDQLNRHQKTVLTPFVLNNKINLPTLNDILLANYPFIEKVSPEILQQLLTRTRKVNELVDYAIKHQRGPKLEFNPLDCKEKFILDLVKNILNDLNKFLYKHDIKKLHSNLILLNNDSDNLFLGKVDLVATNGHDWFLLTYKTSKVGYTQKYAAELFLQQNLWESNTNKKIKQSFILTPRGERVITKPPILSKQEVWKLQSWVKNNLKVLDY